LELPLIHELKLEQLRKNISRLKGEYKADTIIARNYPFFHLGMADWSVISTQVPSEMTQTQLNLGLGGILAGGETNINILYDNSKAFTLQQQRYLWRYANNNHAALRQVMLGKLPVSSVSTLFSPVIGTQITNTPTSFRKSFGSYTISDHTEPGWIVELYVNNVLIDYVKADASGYFSFQMPLVYGNSEVRLRYFSPWGEEKNSIQNINIPFTFLPVNDLEYTVSTGMVEDTSHSLFSNARINYGLGRRITLGGGMEYITSLTPGNFLPFINTSFCFNSGLLFSSEYTHGVRSKNTLTWHSRSNFQLEVNYTRYKKGQTAISNNYSEERKLLLYMPFRLNNLSIYSRLIVNQYITQESTNTLADFMVTGFLWGVNTNFTTYYQAYDNSKPAISGSLSLAFRCSQDLTLLPQIYRNGFLKISYERYF
ncbi:MAG: hypothetical protein NTU44_05200, partial [Bacteroidetes bacterium]|nr:hypothetical protein [Bacteroidota bacterium]